MTDELTPRQRAFVRAYKVDPNATKAARTAGYSGDDNALAVTGSKLLRNPKVAALLTKAEAKAEKRAVMDRAERQELLTKIARGEEDDWIETRVEGETEVVQGRAKLKDRLKAVEVLGKMEGDFIERREVTGANGAPLIPAPQTREEAIARLEAALSKLKGGA